MTNGLGGHASGTVAGVLTRRYHGLRVAALDGAVPFYVLSEHASAQQEHEWYRGYTLSVEVYRGLEAVEDHLFAGLFAATLRPGESLTLVASTEANPNLDGNTAYADWRSYQQGLLDRARLCLELAPPAVEHLVLAVDQFIVQRSLTGEPEGRSIIAGYPWFGGWGRDTMISLPGLTLVTGRHGVAVGILKTCARFVHRGMPPNRFLDEGQSPEYNAVGATLWYLRPSAPATRQPGTVTCCATSSPCSGRSWPGIARAPGTEFMWILRTD